MQKIFLLFIFFILASKSFGNINNIPIHLAGISVSFLAPPQAPETVDLKTISFWKRGKAKKELEAVEKEFLENPPPPIPVKRFIRVINAMSLEKDEYLALVFYNQNKEFIEAHIVTNTSQPSPRYIFFMDRNTGKHFKGKLDHYHIPKDADRFNVAVINDNNTIVKTLSHPGYNKDNMILVSDYLEHGGKSKVMFQFEVLGTSKKPDLKISGFRF